MAELEVREGMWPGADGDRKRKQQLCFLAIYCENENPRRTENYQWRILRYDNFQ